MDTVTPLRPEDVQEWQRAIFPSEVLKVWNDLIAKNWKDARRTSVVMQNEAVLALIPLTSNGTRGEVFASGWLDIEGVYRSVGWKVTYDKPAYYETYEASFSFQKP